MLEHLADEERVAFGLLEDRLDQGVWRLAAAQRGQQLGDRRLGEAPHRHPDRLLLPHPRGHRLLERLADIELDIAIGPQSQQRHSREMRSQVLQQPNGRVVGPVQVIEQKHHRLATTPPSEQVEHRVEQHAALLLRFQNGRLGHIVQHHPDLRDESRQIGGVHAHRVAQRARRAIPQQLFEDFDERRERRLTLLVAVSGEGQHAPLVSLGQHFLSQPRLADARLAPQLHEGARPGGDVVQAHDEFAVLGVASHQWWASRATPC